MPIGFLSPADRDRLNHFPAQIPDDDLRAFFLLSDADQQLINRQREPHTRLGFALQLCALRYLGFAPDDLSTTPEDILLQGDRTILTILLHDLEGSCSKKHSCSTRRERRR
jgi:hypothetical protein